MDVGGRIASEQGGRNCEVEAVCCCLVVVVSRAGESGQKTAPRTQEREESGWWDWRAKGPRCPRLADEL